ncbi:ABC transporter permease [Fodinicola feengrottensis]|uniref:ABC transporter permease n=1 Tax=Fodinicola feengrottensis TaxID=435914 RepID=A0ABP4UY46_9ACTN
MSTFAPAPGRAPMSRILLAQSAMELKLTLRRGESLLLTLVIPILVLLGIGLTSVVRLPTADRMGFVVPGVMGLAVMSTAFTGQAIATGFERSYGVLKRLGASALPRWGLMVAKTVGVIAVIVLQVAVLAVVGLLAGWHPSAAGILPALGLAVVGTAAFSGLGLWMAGTLRAEATLAAANLVYLLMLAVGGVVTAVPSFAAGILGLLPLDALTTGMRAALTGGTVPLQSWLVLLFWAVVSISAAARFFKWE